MNRRKLEKLKREAAQLRKSPQKAAALQSLAKRLGRKLVNRGKHPMWESEFTGLYALSIPDHGAKDLAPGTRNSVLNQLEEDIACLEEMVSQQEEADGGNGIDDDAD